MSGTYNKRYVTRQVLAIGNGQVQCRETYLDGTERIVYSMEWQWRRWLSGAAEGPAVRHKIGRPRKVK